MGCKYNQGYFDPLVEQFVPGGKFIIVHIDWWGGKYNLGYLYPRTAFFTGEVNIT
jgi:hypothetical protein